MIKYTKKQQKELEKNPYTYKATENRLFFTKEFKKVFWIKYNAGMSPRAILKELGYDLSYFSQSQIDNIVQHLRKKSIAGEEFSEGYAKEKRPNIKLPLPNTSPETIQQMQNEITYLKQEIEFLKKVSDQGRAP